MFEGAESHDAGVKALTGRHEGGGRDLKLRSGPFSKQHDRC